MQALLSALQEEVTPEQAREIESRLAKRWQDCEDKFYKKTPLSVKAEGMAVKGVVRPRFSDNSCSEEDRQPLSAALDISAAGDKLSLKLASMFNTSSTII